MDGAEAAELRRRLKILKEHIEQGKIKFAPHLVDGVRSSLYRIRYGPDGEVDLDTVDGRVRAMALAITAMKDRDDTKSVASIRDVQEAYFSFIEKNFGSFYEVMVESGVSPHQFASALSRDHEAVKELGKNIPDVLTAIAEFWDGAGDVVAFRLEDERTLKAVFGGDLFPSERNVASLCGIYTDTIILPDPFLQSKVIFELAPDVKRVFYALKHGLNVLQYKELALAETAHPIVAIVPNNIFANQHEQKFLNELGHRDALIHARKLFGRPFESLDEVKEFLEPLSSTPQAVAAVVDRSRLLFEAEWIDPLDQQLERYMRETVGELLSQKSKRNRMADHAGHAIFGHFIGRMSQANDILLRSQRFGASPLIDAPTSWRYLARPIHDGGAEPSWRRAS